MKQNGKAHDLKCMACSLPVVKLANLAKNLAPGEAVKATSDNPGFEDDVHLLCESTGLVIISMDTEAGLTTVVLKNPAS